MAGVHSAAYPELPSVRERSLARQGNAMTFEPHVYVLPWDVLWFWGCVASPEQHASRQVAAASLLIFPYAVADVVDLEFVTASPLWWEKRRDAWRSNWQIVEEEIEIAELTVRVYSCAAAWAGLLGDCILSDGCAAGDSDCPSRPAFGHPDA